MLSIVFLIQRDHHQNYLTSLLGVRIHDWIWQIVFHVPIVPLMPIALSDLIHSLDGCDIERL